LKDSLAFKNYQTRFISLLGEKTLKKGAEDEKNLTTAKGYRQNHSRIFSCTSSLANMGMGKAKPQRLLLMEDTINLFKSYFKK